MTTPSLAIPALTMAICSGLAATSNWPIALKRQLRGVEVVGELARHAVQVGQVPGVEAELLRLDPELVLPELQAEVGERGVAGHAQRLVDA